MAAVVPCTRKIQAWRGRGDDGFPKIVFTPREGFHDLPVQLPCGKCPDCQSRKRGEWAARMAFEAREHDATSFVTLTYDEHHVPEDYGLEVRDWQLFAKRLRKKFGRFRYFTVGEYGGRGLRPHFHAVVYGLDFARDREFWKLTPEGYPLYRSKALTDTWAKGDAVIGTFTPQAASYVAKYVQKGDQRGKTLVRVDPVTGQCWDVRAEFATMSRRPGIGRGYFDAWRREVYQHDSVVVDGAERPVPRYYDRLLKDADPEAYEDVLSSRRKRVLESSARDPDFGDGRRSQVRERIVTARGALSRNREEF